MTIIADHGRPSGAGILHLGLGSFHRAHQAVYTRGALQAADGPWGIIGVASRSHTVVDALHAQDLRYSVATIAPDSISLSVPGVHTDAFVGADEPARVVAHIADADIRIITLTVTENGYGYSPATQHLDLDDDGIRADLRGEAPRTTIGQLARGVQARAAAGGAPLSILSCDNLAANGKHTEKLVREFLHELPDAEGADALAFLDRAVTFPSSMVDRIVGLEGVRSDFAMLEVPGGHGRLELIEFVTPEVRAGDAHAPANALGLRHLCFAVDDLDDTVARLRTHGAELVGEVVQYGTGYRLCYLRGPEGIIVELAERSG